MRKYVLGISGGCDSMTLLDKCRKEKMKIIVAHVNYQKRESAWRDEQIVRDYCAKYDIPFFVRYCDPTYKGNFQDYARQFRYNFFKELCDQEVCDCVLVAHHEDDLLETYLIQKQRKSIPLHYGLQEKVKHHGIIIERPLLNMTKEACYKYCHENNVIYGEDEINSSNDYLRNRLRKEIACWTIEKRNEILKEILELNKNRKDYQDRINHIVDDLGEDILIKKFKKIEFHQDVLRTWLNRHHIGYDISDRRLNHICETILLDNSNYQFEIDSVKLMKSYDVVQLVENIEYSYTFDTIDDFDCKYFKIRKTGSSVEAVTLKESDFPITIRSPKLNDSIQLRYGKKKINRFFIDRKISHKERKVYPIVVNCKGNVILVPKIGCDIEHYTIKPNCFVIK